MPCTAADEALKEVRSLIEVSFLPLRQHSQAQYVLSSLSVVEVFRIYHIRKEARERPTSSVHQHVIL